MPLAILLAGPEILSTLLVFLDIIDYAKVIGNRAAGREFSVAESSIREWRKNEDKLRLAHTF